MKVLVLIADGVPDSSGEIINIESLDLSNLEARGMNVPVTLNFSSEPDDIIGVAKISVEDTNVYADVTYLDTSKANAKKEIPMHPCIGGYIFKKDEINPSIIKKFMITELTFSISGNADRRIEKA